MSEYYLEGSRPGPGTPIEWEEAMREGEPTGDPFVDRIHAWTVEQIRINREPQEPPRDEVVLD